MKIALIVPEFPPDVIGGGGPVFESLANALTRRGHDVRVLTSSTHGGPPGNDAAYPFPILRVRQFKHFTPQFRTYMPAIPTALLPVRSFLAGADVYNLHGYGMPFVDSIFNFFVPARRSVFTSHGFPYTASSDAGGLGTAYRIYDRVFGSRILRRSARVTAISCALAAEVQAAAHRDVAVVHNGFVPAAQTGDIDPAVESELAKGPYLLGVGRLEPRKAFDSLLRAAALLRERGLHVRVVLAGADNGSETSLRSLESELGLHGAVSYLGEISRSQLGYCYARAACVVVSAVVETFGLVSLEAMSYGAPVAASATGGILDVVRDGENGLLFPPGEGAALAQRVERILREPHLRQTLGNGARATLPRFSWEQIAAEYEQVYRSCL